MFSGSGVVTRVESFGAFVEISPGVEGLVHVSNISRKRVENPADVLAVGQRVEAMVLEIKEGGRRIGLGMKRRQHGCEKAETGGADKFAG